MSTENLWGNLEDFKDIKTPQSILREQGELLTQATQGVLRGEVEFISVLDGFMYNFYILVPQLNNYTYQLLKIKHKVKIYPVKVLNYTGSTKTWITCPTEKAFSMRVKRILSSPKIKDIIGNLLSQCNF